jgi:hypothetical protein
VDCRCKPALNASDLAPLVGPAGVDSLPRAAKRKRKDGAAA